MAPHGVPGREPPLRADGTPAPEARLEVLEGGRAGSRFHLVGGRSYTVGRSPRVSIPLDAEVDLDVSREHAALEPMEGGWVVRDLESRNGTWLNGRRIRDAETLADGDLLRFGAEGPTARFRTGETNTARLRRRGRKRAWTVGLVSAALLAVMGTAGVLVVRGEREDRAHWEAERAQLEAAVDSLLEREARATGVLDELDRSLEASRAEVTRLRNALRDGEAREGQGRTVEMEELRRELEEATQALGRQQLAATLDFDRIEERARRAVVQVFVEGSDGKVATGTGFAVTAGAVIATSRHLLEGESGTDTPRQVAIQFADSRQIWPAEEVRRADTDDLALLRAGTIGSQVPYLEDLGEGRPAPGDPVAILGFPLGSTPDPSVPESERAPARPLVSAGIVSESGEGELLVQGWGEPGASGSPVLDGDGRLVGVVMGGERTARGGLVVVVPAQRLRLLLEAARSNAPG
ncbi:MAG: FHA domain-containing protein [Gemmatimonadales bacterium]|nr:MAG: FHA domain-containing protein [Gemmatimonadales bacterium]